MSVPQLSHEQGVDVQTSFMFLTIGLVPMLVSHDQQMSFMFMTMSCVCGSCLTTNRCPSCS